MKVGLIGAGSMAAALARGWGDPVLATDSGSGNAAAPAAELGGEAVVRGSTARGLAALERNGLRGAFSAAMNDVLGPPA